MPENLNELGEKIEDLYWRAVTNLQNSFTEYILVDFKDAIDNWVPFDPEDLHNEINYIDHLVFWRFLHSEVHDLLGQVSVLSNKKLRNEYLLRLIQIKVKVDTNVVKYRKQLKEGNTLVKLRWSNKKVLDQVIRLIYQHLTDNHFIACTYSTFEEHFKELPTTNSYDPDPIQWTGDLIELAAFVYRMIEKCLIIENPRRARDVIVHHFKGDYAMSSIKQQLFRARDAYKIATSIDPVTKKTKAYQKSDGKPYPRVDNLIEQLVDFI